VLQLGRMVPRKGVETVIRALALVERRYDPRPLLVIVGRESPTPDPALTPEIGRLARVAVEERVAHDVLFVGQRPRHVLRYFYGAADVFVTMPWYEPFGITPVEAAACGVRVVGARVGGIQYSVQASAAKRTLGDSSRRRMGLREGRRARQQRGHRPHHRHRYAGRRGLRPRHSCRIPRMSRAPSGSRFHSRANRSPRR
jgi:glycogen synthase